MPTEPRDRRDPAGAAALTPRRPLAAHLKAPAWALTPAAPDRDVVLASRARLARNLAGLPFPGRADDGELRRAGQEIRRAALADTERLADLSPIWVAALPPDDRAELVDARRITPELAAAGPHAYALLNEGGMLSLFLNEEDHLRVQALAAGNAPQAALAAAEDADRRLARRLRYAYSDRWGYLTAALSNLGTGLRLSVLAHLPALEFLGRLPETLGAAEDLDISVRGAHGERSRAAGSLYQVSNAVTWGRSARIVGAPVCAFAEHLVVLERAARAEAAAGRAAEVVERAHAAWRAIESAERLDAAAALGHLSALRLAAAAGLTGGPKDALFAQLVAELRTGAELSGAAAGGAPGRVSIRDAIHRPARLRSALRRP